MNKPIWDRLSQYAQGDYARFHMPGHKGNLPHPWDEAAPLDVTELDVTGDLYREGPEGTIRQSESQMAALYGTGDCLYLTGGATQGVMTMLAAATRPGDTLLVDRMSHQSVYNAMALLDLHPVYLRRDTLPDWHIPGALHPPDRRQCALPVLYTSPAYHGLITPRPSWAEGVLLCDAAHGAHLPFALKNYSPPGHVFVVSQHKTLGALGQSACLLTDGTLPAPRLRELSTVFGTASPSFLLLASLEFSQEADGLRDVFARTAESIARLAERDSRILTADQLPPGYTLDPLRLTIRTGDGRGDARRLIQEQGVVPEMADRDTIVFLLSPYNTPRDRERLAAALAAIPVRPPTPPPPLFPIPQQAATPKEAFRAPREQVPLSRAEGRIAAQSAAPFPPGIPLLVPGEKIDKITLEILSSLWYNGRETIWVLS